MNPQTKRGNKRTRKIMKNIARMAGAAVLTLAFNAAAQPAGAQPAEQGMDASLGLSAYQQDLREFVDRNEAAFANVRFFFLDQQTFARLEQDGPANDMPKRGSDRQALERAYRENAASYGIDFDTPAVRKGLLESFGGIENPENPFPEAVDYFHARANNGGAETNFVATPDNPDYAGHCFIIGPSPYVTDRTALLGHSLILDDNIVLPGDIKRETLQRFIMNEELGHCGHLARLHDTTAPGTDAVKSVRALVRGGGMDNTRFHMLGEGTAMAFSLLKTLRETGDTQTLRFMRNAVAMYPFMDISGSMYYDISPVIQAAWDFAADPANHEKLAAMSTEDLLSKAEELTAAAYNATSDAQVGARHKALADFRKGHQMLRKPLSDMAEELAGAELPQILQQDRTAFLSGWQDMQAQGVSIRTQSVPFEPGYAAYRAALQKTFATLKDTKTGKLADKDSRLVYLAEARFKWHQAQWGASAASHKTLQIVGNGGGEIPPAMRSYFSGLEHGDWFNAADARDVAMAGARQQDYAAPEMKVQFDFEMVFEQVAAAAADGRLAELADFLNEADAAVADGALDAEQRQALLDEALVQSANSGQDPVVAAMIARGANPGYFDAFALQWAAANGHESTVDILLKEAARMPLSGLNEAQEWARSEGNDKIALRIGQVIRARQCHLRPASCAPAG